MGLKTVASFEIPDAEALLLPNGARFPDKAISDVAQLA
jgi:hypothetical protein